MWMKHPEIAKRWTAEGKGYVKGKKKTKKKGYDLKKAEKKLGIVYR